MDRNDVPPKRREQLDGLHGVTSQKMILFIIELFQAKTSKKSGKWTDQMNEAQFIVVLRIN
jgi:hypothetical protein